MGVLSPLHILLNSSSIFAADASGEALEGGISVTGTLARCSERGVKDSCTGPFVVGSLLFADIF